MKKLIVLCFLLILSLSVCASAVKVTITPIDSGENTAPAESISEENAPTRSTEEEAPPVPMEFYVPEDTDTEPMVLTIEEKFGYLTDGENGTQGEGVSSVSAENCDRGENCPLSPFRDTDNDLWWHDGIHFCVANGLMKGTGEGTFSPDDPTTRGMIVTILFRQVGELELSLSDTTVTEEGDLTDRGEARKAAVELWEKAVSLTDEEWQEKELDREEFLQELSQLWYVLCGGDENNLIAFPDVPLDQWYAEGCYWAAADGLVTGYGPEEGNKFGPDDNITREQLAAILYRYAQYLELDVSAKGDLTGYGDAKKVSGYAKAAMEWACGVGILNGDELGLRPQGEATRAEAATMLYRFCENVVK